VLQGPLTRLEYGFVGQIYEFVMQRPLLGVANLFRRLDSLVVDSAMVGIGRSTQSLSEVLRMAVSGNTQHYGLMMAAGVLVLLAMVLYVR
jgi:hypothetical protein